jgi:nicotinamidase-related amidase
MLESKMTKTALILIDIQNDYFKGGKWVVDQMEQAAQNARCLLDHARATGDMVIHIQHEILGENAPFFAKGSMGVAIADIVGPLDWEKVIVKHRPNSFHETDLREYLQEQGIHNVTLCGAMSQMCIDATARAACDFGYVVTVVEDACGAKEQSFNGIDVPAPMVHATIMAALSGTYAQVVTTDTYLL